MSSRLLFHWLHQCESWCPMNNLHYYECAFKFVFLLRLQNSKLLLFLIWKMVLLSTVMLQHSLLLQADWLLWRKIRVKPSNSRRFMIFSSKFYYCYLISQAFAYEKGCILSKLLFTSRFSILFLFFHCGQSSSPSQQPHKSVGCARSVGTHFENVATSCCVLGLTRVLHTTNPSTPRGRSHVFTSTSAPTQTSSTVVQTSSSLIAWWCCVCWLDWLILPRKPCSTANVTSNKLADAATTANSSFVEKLFICNFFCDEKRLLFINPIFTSQPTSWLYCCLLLLLLCCCLCVCTSCDGVIVQAWKGSFCLTFSFLNLPSFPNAWNFKFTCRRKIPVF